MLSALEGRIIHRLQLPDCSSEISVSRKRKRKSKDTAEKANENDDDNNSVEPWRSSGFYLVPSSSSSSSTSEASSSSPYQEYLLSLPQVLLKQACSAAVYNLTVVITRYALFPLKTSSLSSAQTQPGSFAFLEVYSDGMAFKDEVPPNGAAWKDSVKADDVWTLAQFRRKECLDVQEMKTTRRKNTYKILATVDSISPIIAMDPSDPFALVELYDQDAEENSCVLVLNGPQALRWHAAILPGDTLLFGGGGVLRKPWPVPNIFKSKPAFSHLTEGGRIPSFVFVLPSEDSSTTTISWQPFVNALAPIPPTAIPLVSLEGRIDHVEAITMPRGKLSLRIIHWVEMTLFTKGSDEGSCRLYLTYFPMSTALQLSLKTGATIRAVNVHPMDGRNQITFGACLRSTVTLLRGRMEEEEPLHSSEDNDSSGYLHTQAPTVVWESSQKALAGLSLDGLVPFSLGNIKCSYREFIFRSQVGDWLDKKFRKSTSNRMIAALPTVDIMTDFFRKRGKTTANGVTHQKCGPSDDDIIVVSMLNLDHQVPKQRPKKSTTRNPYAEFFDHASGNLCSVGHPKSESASCGCAMSREEEQPDSPCPVFVGLNEIRLASLRRFAKRFASLANSSPIPRGWSASVHLPSTEVLLDIDESGARNGHGGGASSSQALHIGGYISELNASLSIPTSISDKDCQLPISFSDNPNAQVGDFVVGCVEHVVVSCFCIVAPKRSETETMRSQQESPTYVQESSLPPRKSTPISNDRKISFGGCALLRMDNHILVVAVQLRCETPVMIKKLETVRLCGPQICIEKCLAFPRTVTTASKNSTGKGLLVRRRFRHAKVNSNGTCNCCVLTLSNIPVDEHDQDFSSVSCLQGMELKVSVPQDASKTVVFKRALAAMLSEEMQVLEDEFVLGACWWTVADSGRSFALVNGGWDEFVKGSFAERTAVHVSFPVRAMSIADRGYVRFACKLDDLEATFYDFKAEDTNPSVTTKGSRFDFVGSAKFIDGMLSRRPRRKLVFGPESSSTRVIGERFTAPLTTDVGVPSCKLADIFRLVCSSLCDQDPSILSPSLVRRLSGAHFLGVAFCQVQCICTHCFKPLVDFASTSNKKKQGRRKSDETDEPSFWHLPHPEGLHTTEVASQVRRPVKTSLRTAPHILKSALRCPNQCSVEAVEVKWECSGILDDGTGQAKVYVERDVALTLLGMTRQTIEWVEQGVWSAAGGTVRFNKSVPPSQYLQDQARLALSRATREQRKRKQQQDPLRFLAPATRAEYLLQYHCRLSSRPRRPLDYFVRCKPLADSIRHLNHTMVDAFFPSGNKRGSVSCGVPTYSLPPLKLQLVDCCAPTNVNV
jgi:hypothetical protein